MLRPSFRLSALAFAVAFAAAGCGSSADAPPSVDTAAKPGARSGGPMKVAAVDGRVGDATAATSSGGVTSLKVRSRRTDPRIRQGVGAGASCADVDLLPSVENLPVVAAATLCLVNGERVDAGLPPLAENAKLAQSALSHSLDMVARSYFDHRSQDAAYVTDRVRLTGYIPQQGEWSVGENLAWGTGTLATPAGIVQAWMNSQGHRENILRSGFKEAGLGIALGNPRSTDGEGATYTMNFGSTAGNSAQTVAASLQPGTAPRSASDSTRRAAARRAAARRRKSCLARARKIRSASVRRARVKRCARVARPSSRR